MLMCLYFTGQIKSDIKTIDFTWSDQWHERYGIKLIHIKYRIVTYGSWLSRLDIKYMIKYFVSFFAFVFSCLCIC